jgi:hypothetical protein
MLPSQQKTDALKVIVKHLRQMSICAKGRCFRMWKNPSTGTYSKQVALLNQNLIST